MEASDSPTVQESGTTFLNTEGVIPYYNIAKQSALSSELIDSVDSGYHQTIVHFLQKPYPYHTGTISTTTTGQFEEIGLYGDILALPIYAEKLKGFLGFKATTVIRVQINANRFQQGRILVHYIPQRNAVGNKNEWIRNVNLTQKTQHPRVELDMGTQSECIMEIPYIHPASCLNLQTGKGNLGSIFFDMYSPLTVGTGGSNTCDYTIWVSFKDIEINTPSTGDLVFGTQMDSGNINGSILRKAQPTGSVKAKMAKERETRRTGWLSSALADAADISGSVASLAMPIAPTLSALAAPTNWALSAAANMASSFGWSKPTVTNEPTIVKFGSAPYMVNSDGADTSLVLANQANNEVRVLAGFGNTDIDEMSLKYLTSIPAYFTQFNITTSDAHDTSLFEDLIQPAYYYFSSTSDPLVSGIKTKGLASVSYRTYLPISYFSRFFRYYRGSVKYTLKFVKTEFHSGRLLVSYTPGNSVSIPGNADSTYVFREIIDLRHSNEFSFICPFVATQPYRPTIDTACDDGNSSSFGTFQIRVLNELVAPGSVSSSITCLVEVSAADDFELAYPVPFVGSDAYYEYESAVFTTQMDSVNDLVGATQKCIGSSKIVNPNNLSPAEHCIGEVVTSIKQLLTRFSQTRTTYEGTSLSARSINPWVIGTYAPNADDNDYGVAGVLGSDYYAFLASCFCYARGSIRIGFTPSSTTAQMFVYQGLAYEANTFNTSNGNNFHRVPTQFQTVSNTAQNNNFTEVKLPMYTPTPFFYNHFTDNATSKPNPTYFPKNYLCCNTATATTVQTYRAVGDDYQCGFFICCPPVIYNIELE